jgi:hypothetical protein
VAFSVNCAIVTADPAAPTTYVLAVGAVLAVILIVSYDCAQVGEYTLSI